MSKFTKFVVVLFIIAITSATAATGAEQKPSETPSGSLHFEEWQFMAILAGDWGH